MKKFLTILIFIFLISFSFLNKIEAAGETSINETNSFSYDPTYELLAPIGSFEEYSDNNIQEYLNFLLKIGIGLCGALAVVIFTVYAFIYMGEESIFGKQNAKRKMGDAIFGLIVALASWAILYTIDPDLLGGRGLTIPSAKVTVDMNIHGDTAQSPVNGYYCNGKYKKNASWTDDTSVREELAESSITVNKDNCTYVGQTNCTSVWGLNTTPVIALQKKVAATCSGCKIIITGGTECWLHSSGTRHLPGNSTVDLRDDTLSTYVETGEKTIEDSYNYPIYTTNGARFMDEGNHYHIISW